MSSFLRLRTMSKSMPLSLRRTPLLRTYASKNDGNDSQTTHQQDSPNHPIPSNKAHPTLRDGNQSPLADQDGNLKDDLPADVKKHNEEMEERYDKPYNHTGDQGGDGAIVQV
ncbi:serine-rich protein [Penicillium brevicompactum]|uniref:Serine-rich protein n=1 Tax=Penicillium brevicompactum TaxID=5074 RepID=A0A9W9QM40_PENBR|nr:serine-rich protein [Penicillium brevicompactum]